MRIAVLPQAVSCAEWSRDVGYGALFGALDRHSRSLWAKYWAASRDFENLAYKLAYERIPELCSWGRRLSTSMVGHANLSAEMRRIGHEVRAFHDWALSHFPAVALRNVWVRRLTLYEVVRRF